MDALQHIEKRVKRHVLGKTRSFFVSTSPGTEQLCFEELASLGLNTADATVTKGGIELAGRVHECYLANLRLRTANRILMRIEGFHATNFRQLAKKLESLPWELYLPGGAPCAIHVTSRHSRLFHKDAIADQFKESVAKQLPLDQSDSKTEQDLSRFPQQIFVRAFNDAFAVSIDSSGDLLHKRGLKTQGGRAPIRETVAAAVLALAGYRGGEPLFDPMCGSGTFSLEGAMIANHIPAGWYRSFAFMGWPCFRPARWRHIRGEAEKLITRPSEPIVFASDKDGDTCKTLAEVIRKNDLSGTVSVYAKNFFDLRTSDIEGLTKRKPGLVVINPPYGRRLETQDRSDRLFFEICEKLRSDFRGWKTALVAPKKDLIRRVPFAVTAQDFFHGGLNLILLTGRI